MYIEKKINLSKSFFFNGLQALVETYDLVSLYTAFYILDINVVPVASYYPLILVFLGPGTAEVIVSGLRTNY